MAEKQVIMKMLYTLISLMLLVSCGEKNTHPNILLILADDLGYNQLGCFGGPYSTPGIDKLAEEGMRFTNAYSSAAICSPTRAALMTGKYPARLHLTDFIKGNDFPDKMLKQPAWQKFLPLEEITLGEIFRQNGYRTAIFGKWHLSIEKTPPESAPYNPDKQGFDEYMVTYKPRSGRTNPEHDPHNVDSITDRSLRFLEENRENPFVMVVSHNAIHDPIMESKERIDEYESLDQSPGYNVNPKLGAMVTRLDDGTVRLLDKLQELGLEQNTIVFFCSDNGGREKYANQKPFRKGKGWLYEGGIHVPMIVRWPGEIKSGLTNETVTSTIDILPTILDLAGISSEGNQFDGRSIAGALLENKELESSARYWHYPHYHGGSGMKPASALRKGNYKLIEWHEELLTGGHAWELYDLIADPGESTDLSKTEPELLEEMLGDLNEWRDEVNAQMPEQR
ncbi:hypothetical protein LCGC14_2383840 [marine sediment metagenome]|uniref:Sulfatase N-terminal domain-containing protein n=1 Tax=marine sediment metagenome TaxID=412755 RepID=A0A0F9C088_9ZZZZ